jgi:hypothetical protein
MTGGPTPKNPELRARTNKTSTKAILRAVADFPVPPLPTDRFTRDGEEIPWHPRTIEWWEDVWSSPMGPEYDDSDLHGLIQLAELVDLFNYSESTAGRIKLASEIRQQRTCFGLTPIDRRRLQWTIDQGEAAEDRTAKRRASRQPAPAQPGDIDPRAMLA